jgi:glycosyltransferase A (GT-A) superfamily protein (DUF2064 family)
MMGKRRGLLLFTRSPEEEALAKGLPLQSGSRLFGCLLDSWRDAALDTGAELLIAAPPSSVRSLAGRLARWSASIDSQRGASPSDRFRDAIRRAFEQGLEILLVAGGDSPPPARGLLELSFGLLETGEADVVLEPSTDGGANLIGLSGDCPAVLGPACWGSPKFAEDVSRAAAIRGDRLFRLPPVSDLDRIADVARALSKSFFDPVWRNLRPLLAAVLDPSAPSWSGKVILPQSLWETPPRSRAPPPIGPLAPDRAPCR